MSVIGIDFGNSKTCVAVARNRGIDIVVNEVSNRFTPTMVSFNGKQRLLGEGAKTQEIMRFKNTVTNLKRFIGRDFKESEVQEVEMGFQFYNLVEGPEGVCAAKVSYNDEDQLFDFTQLTAMFLSQIKATTEKSLESAISAAVISVPAYFTDRQRHAILSAAEVANLNCVRLMNEPTAAALAYGITRVSELPEKDPRNVVFIDVGHSAMTVSVASFTKEKAEVKATAFDRHVGGRTIDKLILEHFIEKIKEKHKVDITSNPKTVLRLKVACEKAKQILSSNPQAPVQIECLTDTLDINFVFKREELEEMAAHVFEKITSPIMIALHQSGLKKEDIHFVEIIGGSTRTPAIQKKIADFFEKPELLSKTLNMDEAIARGCSLQCAIVSPLFKVRDYNIKDVTAYGIKVRWDAVSGDAGASTDKVIFRAADSVPSTKAMTFYRSAPFEIKAEYADQSLLPPGASPFIGNFKINDVKPNKDGGFSDVKIKVRINESGIFGIAGADLLEEVEAPAPMETDEAGKDAAKDASKEESKDEVSKDESGDVKMAEGEKKTVKKLVKKADLPVTSQTNKMTPEVLDKFREIEGQMIASDKLIFETQEKKNSLESYIYEMRNKIEGNYTDFLDASVKEKFSETLTTIENWLYDEGDEATKSVFVEKLAELQKVGQPMEVRYREFDERPAALSELKKAVDQFKTLAASEDPKYEHIEADERKKVEDECAKQAKFLQDATAEFDKLKKTENPKTTVSQIKQARESLVMTCARIMNKPKPKPKEEPPKEAPKAEEKEGEKKEEKKEEGEKKEEKKDTNMDVD